MNYTKKQINEDLKNVWNIYAGKIEDRYTGLSQSECITDIQKVFYNVITHEDFSYKNKKEQYNEVYKRFGIVSNENKEFTKTLDGVIIRNLPANDNYLFIDSGSFAEMEGWCCENCGRFIKHWNEVKSTKTNKLHLVGSECINTVLKYDINENWEVMQKISENNKNKSKIKQIKKIIKEGGTLKLENGYYYVINKEGRNFGFITIDVWNKFNRKGVKK